MMRTTVHSLLDDPRYREALLALAAQNRKGLSAGEFIAYLPLPARAGANIGYKLGLRIGLKSATSDSFALPLNPTISCMSVCTALVNGGIEIAEILERDDKLEYGVLGSIPSSPLHWNGTLVASVSPDRRGAQITLNIVFHGQIFAWGAGSRLMKRIKGECIALSERVAALAATSMADRETLKRLE